MNGEEYKDFTVLTFISPVFKIQVYLNIYAYSAKNGKFAKIQIFIAKSSKKKCPNCNKILNVFQEKVVCA